MTWEIVLGIIALVSFGITVGAIVVKITKALAVLTTTLDTLCKTTAELEKVVRHNTEDIIRIKEHMGGTK